MNLILRIVNTTNRRTRFANFVRYVQTASIPETGRISSISFQRSSCYGSRQTVPLYQYTGVRFYSDDLPPHTKVLLPALSPTMEMGTIVSWAKKPGDKLNEGDLLAEIETDKATMGFETPEEGYLAKILVPAGTRDVPIGKLVCIITEEESQVELFKNFEDSGSSGSEMATKTSSPSPEAMSPPPPAPQTSQQSPVVEYASEKGRIYTSPMARRLAQHHNIRLESVGKGSGLFDSISSKDIEGLVAGKTPIPSFSQPISPQLTSAPPSSSSGKFIDHPMTNIRSVIAKRLSQSKQTIPHYYLSMELNAENMLHARTILNKELEGFGTKLSVNDFIIKATALASKKVPAVNSSWMDTHIREYQSVDVSVAVSTRRGLITPIIFEAEKKRLSEISNTMKNLALKAREGKLQPHEFQGGTVSVSNLGMYGITHFSAVINPPQSCILAVGGLQDKVIASTTKPGSFAQIKTLTVTLSCDHRVVDGAVGAEWLAYFKQLIESPQNFYEELQ